MKEDENYIGEKVGDVENMDALNVAIKNYESVDNYHNVLISILINENPNDADLGRLVRMIYG